MKKKGWQGASNPFVISMEVSNDNALGIVTYHLAQLQARQGESAGILAMFTDFKTPANSYIDFMAQHTGDLEGQKVLTEDFESEFKDMGSNLDNCDSIVRVVHAVGTVAYNLIMGKNRDRFYQGSYQSRIAALTGMSKEMVTQAVPLGVTAVNDYITAIQTKHLSQSTRMGQVGIDATTLKELKQTLTKKLNKNRGWLLFNYGDDDDCQKQVNAFFPLNILGDRSVKGHYQLLVPKGDFRKICIHLFNEGETVDLEIGDADVWISMADNAAKPISSGYLAKAGSIVTVNPSVFGDLTKKYIIATNTNLTVTSDVIFNIIAAPKGK